MIDIFARAAHAPQSSVRVPAGALETVEPILRLAVSATPLGDAVADRILADFGIPRSVLVYVNYPTHFDSRQTEMALRAPTSPCRRWRPTPASSGTTGSATSIRTCSATGP